MTRPATGQTHTVHRPRGCSPNTIWLYMQNGKKHYNLNANILNRWPGPPFPDGPAWKTVTFVQVRFMVQPTKTVWNRSQSLLCCSNSSSFIRIFRPIVNSTSLYGCGWALAMAHSAHCVLLLTMETHYIISFSIANKFNGWDGYSTMPSSPCACVTSTITRAMNLLNEAYCKQ